jgi:crotonobetainyl-CoA:carnitine CoA-transferase CaiB-like acyl-CoA transferase
MDQVISDPVNVDGLTKLAAKRAPDMGEQTDDVLLELGYSADDIASLRANGIV